MTRHILRVYPSGTWRTIATPTSCESDAVCAALEEAVETFMAPPRREGTGLRALLAALRDAFRIPEPPVTGWFWIDLGRDGNLDIGSRLTPTELAAAIPIPDRIR